MLTRLATILVGFGCLLLVVSGIGMTSFCGRWYGKEWVSGWVNEYGTDNKKVADSVCASAAFGSFSALAALVGLVLFLLDLVPLVNVIVFATTLGLTIIGFIPTGIVVGSISVFDEEMSPTFEQEYLWVPLLKRNLVNTSEEYNSWFFGYWQKQLNSVGKESGTYIAYNVLPDMNPYFRLPASAYWDSVYHRFISVAAWNDRAFSSAYVYGCVIDFGNSATVWDYQGQDVGFCDSLNLVTSECIGRWNQKRITESYQQKCRAWHDEKEKSAKAKESPEAYTEYIKEKDDKFSTDVVEEGFATLYITNCIFLCMQVIGALYLIAGVVLSYFFAKNDAFASLNSTKLIE